MVLFIVVHRCSSTRKYIIVEKGHDLGYIVLVSYLQSNYIFKCFAAGHTVVANKMYGDVCHNHQNYHSKKRIH